MSHIVESQMFLGDDLLPYVAVLVLYCLVGARLVRTPGDRVGNMMGAFLLASPVFVVIARTVETGHLVTFSEMGWMGIGLVVPAFVPLFLPSTILLVLFGPTRMRPVTLAGTSTLAGLAVVGAYLTWLYR